MERDKPKHVFFGGISKADYFELLKEYNSLLDAKGKAELDLRKADSDADKIEREHIKLQQDYRSAAAEINDLRKLKELAEKQIGMASELEKKLVSAEKSSTEQKRLYESKISDLNSQLKNYQSQIAELEKKTAESAAELTAKYESMISGLKSQVKERETEVAVLENAKKTAECVSSQSGERGALILQLEKQIEELKNNNSLANQELEKVKEEKHHLEVSVYEKAMAKLGYVFKCLNRDNPDLEGLSPKNLDPLPEELIRKHNARTADFYHTVNSLIGFLVDYATRIHNQESEENGVSAKKEEYIPNTKEVEYFAIIRKNLNEFLGYVGSKPVNVEAIGNMNSVCDRIDSSDLSAVPFMQIANGIDQIMVCYQLLFGQYYSEREMNMRERGELLKEYRNMSEANKKLAEENKLLEGKIKLINKTRK